MQLLVVRHSQTRFNEQFIINSRLDEGLSQKGGLALPALVSKLHDQQMDVIYCSPLKRATETAMPIADDHKVEIQIDRRLIEVDMGSFAGQPYESTKPAFGLSSSDLLSTYKYDFRDYGGETATAVKERVESFLSDLKTKSYDSVLIITHGGIIRWFYYLLSDQKYGKSANLSLHEFDI